MMKAFLTVSAVLVLTGMTDPEAERPIQQNGDITVIGERATTQRARERAQAYIREIGLANSDRPVARWVEPVCPKVIGVSETIAARLVARLRAIAHDTGIPVANAGCSSNIVIAFTHDGNDLTSEIARHRPRVFSGTAVTERAGLRGGGAPIRWWYNSIYQTRDGMSGEGGAPPSMATTPSGPVVLSTADDAVMLPQYSSSIISSQVRRVLTSATIIIDVPRSEGLSLNAVTDYVAMVAFAETRPDAASAGSILQLFDEGAAVRALTAYDQRFLSALYHLPLDRNGGQQRGLLMRSLLSDGGGGGG